MPRTVEVFGPAYLDRVVRVDRPLIDGTTIDRSAEGRLEPGPGLTIVDPDGRALTITPPAGWPGPFGVVRLGSPVVEASSPLVRTVNGVAWHDDLGGMGAGYAAALGGTLISALGAGDETSRTVAALLASAGIRHRPILVPGHAADWTLLVTSGPFGDKLPIGFRGCHAAVTGLGLFASCDLRVVAGLDNALAAEALRAAGAAVRLFAPALRNAVDQQVAVADFAGSIDILCCNRFEWTSLIARGALPELPIRVVTDGPRGSSIRFRSDAGSSEEVDIAAFPRDEPPRDTNRAGEAYASTFVRTLLDDGWQPGSTSPALIRRAGQRAAAAAALVLDRERFGFPTGTEIDGALAAGGVRAVAGR
jgi:ribokinase